MVEQFKMEVITIETEAFKQLLSKFDQINEKLETIAKSINQNSKPYLSTQEVMDMTGFGKTWVTENKAKIGYASVGGFLRFKRSDVTDFIEANYFKMSQKKHKF